MHCRLASGPKRDDVLVQCVKQIDVYKSPVAEPELHRHQQTETPNRHFITHVVCDALH